MFVAAVSGAGLAALDSAIEGYMFVFAPLIFVVCYLLHASPDQRAREVTKAIRESGLSLRRIIVALTRPILITLAGFGSFLHTFGYLRG